MSDKSSQNDPSMVEILGSIRRIINEDNAETDSPEAAPGGDEEILDLTEEVAAEDTGESRPDTTFGAAPVETEESEVRREPVLGLRRPGPADEGPAMEQPEAEAEADAEAEPAAEEISEFGRRDQQDMTSAEVEDVPMPDPPEPVQEPLTPPEEAPMAVEPAPVIQPAPAASEEIVRTVISESATTATATALGELTRAMDEKTNQLKVGSETTVSDVVRELLRPMLREWLDENLPTIVERIVRREIQKLVDHAEPDD